MDIFKVGFQHSMLMNKIKQLPPLEAQKIAAGEVVERPVNVVKELVENALDAGATQVTIYIQKAGKQLIRVVDNGCGMNEQDAQLCFGHHATSKINSVDDLTSLATFGFRGEALSSICAVSTVTLSTKDADSQQGIKLILHGGQQANQTPCAHTTGTDLAVSDLFYNVPARKKFLRSDDTEWRQIVHLFHAFCFAYQQVHFKLFQENRLVHNCPPTQEHATRLAQLWDHSCAQHMLSLQEQNSGGVTISGSISSNHYYRYDRTNIFLFVNKRWVKNFKLANAFIKGYANILPQGRFPAGCIFIDLPADQVDINIHPRKEEVQFLHPRRVEVLVQEAVKTTLEQRLTADLRKQPAAEQLLSASQSQRVYNEWPDFIAQQTKRESVQFNDFFAGALVPEVAAQNMPAAEPALMVQQDVFNAELEQDAVANEYASTENQEYVTHLLIGQLHKTYILLEHEDGLFVIDQHAAHERILYEQFAARFVSVPSVPLLFPLLITVTKADLQLLAPQLHIFSDHGIVLEPFGEQQLVVKATPVHLKNAPIYELVKEMVGYIQEFQSLEPGQFFKVIHEKLRAQMACKAAVKAGDVLTREQMDQLVRDLGSCNNRLTCPHGDSLNVFLMQ